MMMIMIGYDIRFEAMVRKGQADICKAIEDLDGEGKFKSDAWVRETGGGGISRVLTNGKVFEKAGVNLSVVYGTMPLEALQAATSRGVDRAKGMKVLSTSHDFIIAVLNDAIELLNSRESVFPSLLVDYPLSCIRKTLSHLLCTLTIVILKLMVVSGGLEVTPSLILTLFLFHHHRITTYSLGGTDITPSYLNEEDMKHFHGTYKKVCDNHDAEFYPKFKKWADEYFYIPHRGETRGLGGIFFDDLNDREPEKILAFSTEALNNVVEAYGPLVSRHKDDVYTEQNKEWQLMRRGRYVEFNLVYDRGTIFGLKTGGRIESILMSLPETARWEYDHHPAPGSKEEEITQVFRTPKDWVH
jgi:coproporphyrinogen III oxidase